MNKTIYFIRHGESEANATGYVAGSAIDSPLTEKGRQDALYTASKLQSINFDLIVSSPMKRTIETTNIITSRLNLNTPIVTKEDFIERDVGEYTNKSQREYYEFEAKGEDGPAELMQHMQDRVRRGMKWLKDQDFQTALVVSHGGTIRMVRTIIDNLPAKNFAKLPHPQNGDIYKIQI